ncbi:hypothetical protein SAMN02910456_02367 [Ruminococcaceae bacterium YRB3002]|nr:hypothetical protein SAMN02910456_02367 [Ruminococcaceae bacterium YRB3002]
MRSGYPVRCAAAVVCIASMMLSMAGCSDKNKEAVLEAAGKYAKALCDCSVKSLRKGSAKEFDEDYLDGLRERLEWEGYPASIYSAIGETITYKVNEDSYEPGKRHGASVEVDVEMVDWESIEENGGAKSIDGYISAIEDCEETKQFTLTLEYEEEDGKWVVDNYEDVCDSFYDEWLSATAPVDYTQAVTGTTWYYYDSRGTDNSVIYNNATYIELDLDVADGYTGIKVYFTVTFNGNVIYTSDVSAEAREARFTSSTPGAVTAAAGCLDAGQYRITFYNEQGAELASDECTVVIVDNPDIGSDDASVNAEIFDTSAVNHIRWWYASGRNGTITYENSDNIDLDLYFNTGYDDTRCYYEVRYNGDVVYVSPTSSNTREGYFRSSYVGASVDSEGNLAGGEYTITFYDENDNKLASDTCTVIGGSVDHVTAPLTPDAVTETRWWFATSTDNGVIVYNNPTLIDFDANLSAEYNGTPVYYTVKFNGSVIFTSQIGAAPYSGYFKTTDEGAQLYNDEFLLAGEYSITFYSAGGVELASGTCTVTNK